MSYEALDCSSSQIILFPRWLFPIIISTCTNLVHLWKAKYISQYHVHPLPTASTPHSEAACKGGLYIHWFHFFSLSIILHCILFAASYTGLTLSLTPFLWIPIIYALLSLLSLTNLLLWLKLPPIFWRVPKLSAAPNISQGAFWTSLPGRHL